MKNDSILAPKVKQLAVYRAVHVEMLLRKALSPWRYWIIKKLPFTARLMQRWAGVELVEYPDADSPVGKCTVVKVHGKEVGKVL